MRMKDKVVLVTGGAAGIGKATALRFAEEGAKVVICDVNEAVGQETLKLLGEGAAFYKVNVTSREDVQKWVDDVVAKYGRIDVIVKQSHLRMAVYSCAQSWPHCDVLAVDSGI